MDCRCVCNLGVACVRPTNIFREMKPTGSSTVVMLRQWRTPTLNAFRFLSEELNPARVGVAGVPWCGNRVSASAAVIEDKEKAVIGSTLTRSMKCRCRANRRNEGPTLVTHPVGKPPVPAGMLILLGVLVVLALAISACDLVRGPIPAEQTPVAPSAGTSPTPAAPTASPTARSEATASPAATRSCVALDPQFQVLQRQAEAMKSIFSYEPAVKCPLAPTSRVAGAIQEFRYAVTETATRPKLNYMLWRGDTKTIYLVVKNDQESGASRVYTFQDTWGESEPRVPPDCASIIPPQDATPATDPSRAIQVPVRGFGKIWCKEKWQEAIGFGNGKEIGGTFSIQETAGGLYLAVHSTDGRETTALFLLDTDRGGALAP